MIVVLDAWAVSALLHREPPGPRVERVVDTGDAVISEINLGESLCVLARDIGVERAERVTDELRRRVRVEPADWPGVRHAARLKAAHRLSYADAFCVATAQRHRAPLWTGDPEIVALGDVVDVVDLRAGER